MKNVIIIAIALLVTFSGLCFAAGNNPADLTSSYRFCPARYAKAIYDDGPWSAFVTEPLSKRASSLLWTWHSEDNSKEFLESVIVYKVTDNLQAGIVRDNWRGESDKTSAMLDLTCKKVGFALITPSLGPTQLGFRAQSGNFWVYAATAQKTRPLLGIGHYDKTVNLDYAFGQDRWYFRASKRLGDFVPELRLREQDGEFYKGFAVGYCFK